MPCIQTVDAKVFKELRAKPSSTWVKERDSLKAEANLTADQQARLNNLETYLDGLKYAEDHIKAQGKVIENLRARLNKLEADIAATEALNNPDDLDYLSSLRESQTAIRRDLNGQVKDANGKWVDDPSLLSADALYTIMQRLYLDRPWLVFKDTNLKMPGGKSTERTAYVFGLPTVGGMVEAGRPDLAKEIAARAIALAAPGGDSTKNPLDFIDNGGKSVKLALANQIEWHHIFNNAMVNPETGRVNLKPDRLDPTTGQLKNGAYRLAIDGTGKLSLQLNADMYHDGSENLAQFIALPDALHSGDNAATHLKHYELDPDEITRISDDLVAKLDVKQAQAAKDLARDQLKIADLEAQITPEGLAKLKQGYQDSIDEADQRLKDLTIEAKKLGAKGSGDTLTTYGIKKALEGNPTPELRQAIEEFKKTSSNKRAAQKSLKVLRDAARADRHNKKIDFILDKLRAKMKEAEKPVNSAINKLRKADPSLKGADKLDELRARPEIAPLYAEVIKLRGRRERLKLKHEANSDLMKAALPENLSKEITALSLRVKGHEAILKLTPDTAREMIARANGSFDIVKGGREGDVHEVARKVMNAEIVKFYVRESLDYHSQLWGGQDALASLQALTESQKKTALLDYLSLVIGRSQDAVGNSFSQGLDTTP